MPNPPAPELARLLLGEITGTNTAEQTAELLAGDGDERARATELVLLSILDHITDRDESAFLRDCQAAIARLRDRPDPSNPPLVGLLGLICLNVRLLQRRFEAPLGHVQQEIDEYCAALFRETPIGTAIEKIYRPSAEAGEYERDIWDDLDFRRLTYHKSGTTSFIVAAGTNRPLDQTGFALKCVLFPWNKLASIAKATEEYATTYGAARTAPIVVHPVASTDRWILMPFQEGQTLQEHLAEFEAGHPTPGERIRKAREIGLALLDGLEQLAGRRPVSGAQLHRQHLDLSPNNIILTPYGREIRLIDLGRNHLYSRQVGIAEHNDSIYVAPEVKNRKASPSSDVYSLGVILMQILAGTPPRDARVPDKIWELSPILGRALDDFAEGNPLHRLLLIEDGGDELDLTKVRAFYKTTCDVAASEPEAGDRWQGRWLARLLPASREVTAQYGQWKTVRQARVERFGTGSYLLFFSLIATACWWFVAARTALFNAGDLIADLRLDQAMSFSPDVPAGVDQLAADITAFTQGLLGAKFYQTILARLTVRRVPGAFARVTEVFIRLMVIMPLPATLFAAMWQPWLWAWIGAANAALVALTHWLITVQANRISAAGMESGLSTIPPPDRVFARGYEQWWWTMLLYAFMTAFIAFGLQIGWLQDTLAYVLGFTIISVGIHYVSKLVTAGHAIRGSLARAFSTAERIALLRVRGEAADIQWPPRLKVS